MESRMVISKLGISNRSNGCNFAVEVNLLHVGVHGKTSVSSFFPSGLWAFLQFCFGLMRIGSS